MLLYLNVIKASSVKAVVNLLWLILLREFTKPCCRGNAASTYSRWRMLLNTASSGQTIPSGRAMY